MGSSGVIPFSNPAGNNQTSPPVNSLLPKAPTTGAGAIPGSPAATPGSNPYAPKARAMGASPTGAVATGTPLLPSSSTGTANTSANNGFITSGTDGGQNALNKQLNDIWGSGVGDSLFSLMNSMSGTDSTVLQEYVQSLQPQMATAQANVNASLGAGGVSANSSVAALADSNLQAQETASIAGESASLTQNQEQMTAQILSGMEGSAAKEVASSGWTTFGDVMSGITGDIGAIMGKGNSVNFGQSSGSGSSSDSGSGGIPQTSLDNSVAGVTIPEEAGDIGMDDGMDLAAFS